MGDYRERLIAYIREQAKPVDKFSHQARLYNLACQVGEGHTYDDEVLFAAVWMHDLGVFIGHRPEDPAELSRWNHVTYVMNKAPGVLKDLGFPEAKILAVMEAIRTHQPFDEPAAIEGIIIRDADILEQLGAVGILRAVSKVGRDTRYPVYTDALKVLRTALEKLPGKIKLETTRRLAEARIRFLKDFLDAAEREADGQPL